MSHELHNLVTKIENACDSEFYEVADTEHLVRLAVAEYVVAQNGLVASARVVDPTAAQKVIDRHIRENISAGDPQTWFANVATKIADFLELAYEGTTNNDSADYLDLLPIGHPRNVKNLGLTASARMQAVAEWVAADPRITSDLGRQAVYNAYRAKPDSLEATYANAKIEALCASGDLPQDFAYEAIVASFKNMSFAERSARSKALALVRRRDRWKRFANEFGRLRGFFSKGDGTMFSATGKIAGAVPGENKYYVEYDGSDPDIPKGLYIQDAGKSENVRALLSARALKNAPNLRKPLAEFDKRDQDSAVDLNEFLATKVESPGDWTKNKDGSFTSKTGNTLKEVKSLPEGDYYFEGVGENNEQDLGEPLFEIRDASGELVGVAQDWNGVQKIALTHDKMKEKEAKKAPEINDQTFAEALDGMDDETNWDDLDNEPSYESPNGVLSVSFMADADTDGEGGMQDISGWTATLDPDGEDIAIASWRGGPDDDLGDIAERVSKGYEEYKAKKLDPTDPKSPNYDPMARAKKMADDANNKKTGLEDLTDEEVLKKAEAEAQADNAPARTDGKIGRFVPGRSARDEADKRGLEYTGKLSVNADFPGKKSEAKKTEKSKPSYLDQKPKQYQSTLKKDENGYSTGVNDAGFIDLQKNKDGTYTVDHGYNYMADENSEEMQFDEDSKTFPTEKEALDFANEKLAYYNSYRVDEDAANYAYDRAADGADFGPERGLGQDVPEEAPAKEAKPLSEKQMEPATPKQYALLKEFQEERDGIDENQNQAINDALKNQNLSKAQMAALFGDLQKKPFKPEIDPTKPSDRMINSLRDYLTNKELTTDELNSALDELEAGLDRAGMEKLIAKLRRRPDKAKEESFGQDIPSELKGNLSGQELANGFSFDRSKDGNTWSATGFPNLEETYVEVTENNGKWFTTVKSGGNGESGFTRESEKQHATAQDAFDYASDSINRNWDQDLFDDLTNNFDDEDEIGFAEEEGLGQETPELSEEDKLDAINTLEDSEDYYGLAQLLEDENYFDDVQSEDAILKAMENLKDAYISRKEAAQSQLDRSLDDALQNAKESVSEAISETGADLRAGTIDQQEHDNAVENLEDDLAEFEEYLGASYSRDFKNYTGVLDNAIDMRDSAIQEYDAWEASEPDDLSDVTPGENYAVTPASKAERGLGQEAPSTEVAPEVRKTVRDLKPGDSVYKINSYEIGTVDRISVGKGGGSIYYTDGTIQSFSERQMVSQIQVVDLDNIAPRADAPELRMTRISGDDPATPRQLEYIKEQLDSGQLPSNLEQGAKDYLSRYSLGKKDASAFVGILKKNEAARKGEPAPAPKNPSDATDAQYGYVSSLLNSKQVPEELATAAKQALDDRNLTKSQIGEIIGKLRNSPDKEGFDPNAPTERMVESVKRNIVAKGLSKEDQDAILADLPKMDKATMSELIGRLKAMDDVNAPEAGLSQSADQGPLYDSNEISSLQDRINKLKGEQGISQFIGDDEYTSVDPESVSDALILAADLNAISYKMEPTTSEGKALEADLKKASEDIIKSVEEKLGPVEAAKYEIADGSTNRFDSIFDDVDDFMNYYYPSDTDAIYEELSEGGSIGDVRGGGWEGSVRQNEDGTWLGSVGSPARDSDSYSETFDSSEDAASWVAGSLEQENKYLPDFDVRLFGDGSRSDLDSLIEEYGNDPEVLANKLAGIVNWFRGTNRGMGENIASDISEYLDRLNEIIASQKKSDEQGLGQESPKA